LIKEALKGVKKKAPALEDIWLAYQHILEECIWTNNQGMLMEIRNRCAKDLDVASEKKN
jgi:hypothetical protein